MILNIKDKRAVLSQLYRTCGTTCHYCGIEEKDFIEVWGRFYGSDRRGRRLEIEHKDGNRENWNSENLVLACALCNMSKSDKFTYEEFRKVGKVIREIWQQRAVKKGIR